MTTSTYRLEVRSRHHAVSLERAEAGPLLGRLNSVPEGTPFFRLSLDGRTVDFCPDRLAVRLHFFSLVRQIGLAQTVCLQDLEEVLS